jgi:hypothetical protein
LAVGRSDGIIDGDRDGDDVIFVLMRYFEHVLQHLVCIIRASLVMS